MSDNTWTPGMELREDWLAQVVEDIIDPEREIVDPHHHLWTRAGAVYELDQLNADIGAGHNVVQTIYVECHSYYDETAPKHLQPVGEVAHVAGLNAGGGPVAGIIGRADLSDPRLGDILDAMQTVGRGKLSGIRQAGACALEPNKLVIPGRNPPDRYADPEFRRGVAELGRRGLVYDTWHYHHQADDFLALAQAVPDTVMVLDHFGTPLGVGRFAGQREAIFPRWKDDMTALAECPNVRAKLGGMAMPDNGWGWNLADKPPTSDEFVAAQGAWYHHMIACFGPERCMFESNFPVDRTSVSYPVLWNAFKKIAARYDDAAQQAMFSGTARQTYGL